jgi:hypothetical protein
MLKYHGYRILVVIGSYLTARVLPLTVNMITFLDQWAKLALHKLIQDLGWQITCTHLVMNPKLLSKFQILKEK